MERSVSSRRFMKAPYPPLTRSPFPNGEGLGGATLRVNFYKARCPKVVGIAIWGNAFPTYGGANPVSLRSTAPSRGRGENVGHFECINPSFLWKEVPAGRRLGAQSGVKKERLKQAIYESTRAPLTRSPFPNGEGKSVAASPRSFDSGRSCSGIRYLTYDVSRRSE